MIFRKKYKILTYTQNKTLRRITHEKEIINTTCRGMPNSCTIQRRHNLRTKQNQLRKQKEDTVTTNKYQGVTIKDKAKGKVTKQQVRELKKEHSGKDEKNIIIWEAEEAK